MTTRDRSSEKPQVESKPVKTVSSYVAPRIEKTQKLVEVTGQAISGVIILPP